jgi:pimeloyl-ACP methyl ester carboxylesterase
MRTHVRKIEERNMRYWRSVLLVAVVAATSGCLSRSSAVDGEGFALQPGEPALEEFSRRKRYVEIGPWRVAYIDEGAGPPVVLLHGCPFHAFQWRDLIPQLRERHRVLAPDLLGLGDTQVRLSDDYRLPNDVEMVLGLLDAFGIREADFVTADHGAATLQLLIRDHPERIRRAVITNAEAYDQWPSKPELPYLKWIVNPWLGPLFRFALGFTWVQRELFDIAVHRKEAFTDEVLYAYARAHVATPARWARLQRFFRWQLDPEHNRLTMEAVEGLRRFDKPTLILWGKLDTNFGPAIAERLADDIPGVVGLEYLESSAHMPFQEEPEQYGEAVSRLLDATSEALEQRRQAFRRARESKSEGGTP